LIKPQYAIIRMAKYKGGTVSRIEAHNERTKEKYASNPDIKTELSKYNFHPFKYQGKYRAVSDRMIREAGCKVRKDSVTMVETLITASPEFFAGKKPREIIEFFEYALEFMKTRQDPRTYLSAVVHMDEKTPHMHLCFVPLTPDNRLSAKTIVGNKKALTKLQDDFHAFMVKKYPDFERGESASTTGRKHIPPRLYKEAVHMNNLLEEVCNLIRQLNPLNKKTLMPVIEEKLSKLFRGAESFQTELKKIAKRNKSLAAEVSSLEQQLADNTGSVLKELQEKQRLLELEEKERLLANIPQEIIDKYNGRPIQQELSVNKE